MILLGSDVSRPSFPLLLHGATCLELGELVKLEKNIETDIDKFR